MSLISGAVTLLHTACGAGILAIPFAFKPFGLFPGLMVLVVCGIAAIFGLLLQAKIIKYTPTNEKHSFFILATKLHPTLAILFDLAIAVKCFGVSTSYLIAIGDFLAVLLDNEYRMNTITFVWLFIILPLSYLRKINALRYTSLLAVTSVFYLCILVTYHYCKPSEEISELRGTVSLFLPKSSGISPFKTLPIFVFAYTCHHNMFAVINEQKHTDFKRLKFIPLIAISIACILYLIVGCLGYATFGANITSNIVAKYPTNSVLTVLGQTAMLTVVTLAYPLQCQPARASILNILYALFPKLKNNKSDVEEASMNDGYQVDLEENKQQSEPERIISEPSIILHSIVTSLILFGSWCIAVSVNSLAQVLAIVGATGSTFISFILPGLFAVVLIPKDNDFGKGKTLWIWIGGILMGWGISVMCVSLYAAIFL
ncbi:hypothetical protein TBLA_0F01390 [Henningerozyma blattae CBS 6284]|uniref:Amino acid transporter transmembrane domain-containing protein n=1 Tax=Henningerozyma blattae (strain ATCC 34711 / CBS 6284 / DSM 70876 / NBRC 10599 / NRRL Y-10934 / UCD 77-7) TaxID=1071380 RepID=I2H5N0_HENB6|nr:hypothetical protein TBLA_0F01390 [Tetrapisispora blattae CBS 6284]CCH61682.1 hypothetical protein TBLA_0F01390 [Tetrapisispora blattae CBS 6284]